MTRVQGIGRFMGMKSVLIANVAVLALIGWGFAGEFLRHRAMREEIEALERHTAALEAQNAEASELGRRSAAQGAAEREARLKLGLQKPGESVIIVQNIGLEPARTESQVREPEPRRRSSNFEKWWSYFFP